MPTLNLEENIQWLVLFEVVTLISLDPVRKVRICVRREVTSFKCAHLLINNKLQTRQFDTKRHHFIAGLPILLMIYK